MKIHQFFYFTFLFSFFVLCFVSCSFTINSQNFPKSTHIPKPSFRLVLDELKGTIWKLSEDDHSQNTFLFFHTSKDSYAIIHLRESSSLERYPESYQYKKIGKKQAIDSLILNNNNATINQLYSSSHQYMGFYLLESGFILYSAVSLTPKSITEAFEARSACLWELHGF